MHMVKRALGQRRPTLTRDVPPCAITACIPVACNPQSYTGSSGGASSSRTTPGGSSADPEGYYRMLGVSPASSTQEVQAAFRAAALKWHPDRCAWRTVALHLAGLECGGACAHVPVSCRLRPGASRTRCDA